MWAMAYLGFMKCLQELNDKKTQKEFSISVPMVF